MPANDFDDLFRQQLGGHATPPGPDLQRRLAELAEAERLDARFRAGLGDHASLPPRAVWERLEDEHLRPRPRRRRVAGWWQYSAAAVVLLLLLAGGAGLWRSARGPLPRAGAPVATQPGRAANQARGLPAGPGRLAVPGSAIKKQLIDKEAVASTKNDVAEKNQKNVIRQATGLVLSPSSLPIATATRPRRAAPGAQVVRGAHHPTRQPDAAAGQLATTGGQPAPAGQLLTPPVAPAASGPPAARDNAAAAVTAFAAATAEAGVIEVEVRRGPEPGPAVVAEAPPRPRRHLGGLLRQAGHLVRGEPVSLAEATGLPETLTLHARLGGRTLSKTIDF